MGLATYMAQKGLTDGDLALVLGVSAEAVRLWRRGTRTISAVRAIQISGATGIPRHELRPDLWDPPAAKRSRTSAAAAD